MYANRVTGRIVFDLVDYTIFSLIISIWVAELMKKHYFPNHQENQKMERLRKDLMKKSRLVKLSAKTLALGSSFSSLKNRVKPISTIRGGAEPFYGSATNIKKIVIYLLMVIQNRLDKKNILNFLLVNARSYLCFLLMVWRTDPTIFLDPVTGQSIIVTIAVGGTTGFIISWMGVGTTLLINSLGLFFLTRSLSQQIFHEVDYKKVNDQMRNFLNNEEWQTPIQSPVVTPDSNLKLQPWETRQEFKEAAQRLGIVEEKPPSNSLYKRSLKKLQFRKNLQKMLDGDLVHQDRVRNLPRIKN